MLKEFSKTHRCYALDQRGYNISSKPAKLSDYTSENLVRDVNSFARHVLGAQRSCVLVAHDWGGAVAWNIAHCCDWVSKLVMLDMPHPMTFKKAILTSTSQKRRSLYILFFQLPFLPDSFMSDPAAGRVGKIITGLAPQLRDAFLRAAQQPGAMTAALNWCRPPCRPLRSLLFALCSLVVAARRDNPS